MWLNRKFNGKNIRLIISVRVACAPQSMSVVSSQNRLTFIEKKNVNQIKGPLNPFEFQAY